jgi:vacuolar-type H+-ATPase catalytic subunit A/Vma1
LCTLRHITARHELEDEAREIIKKSYGIGNIIKLLGDKNLRDHFEILKATVGLIKNLALSQTIIPYLCEQNAVRRLGELMMNIERIPSKSSEEIKQYDLLLEITIGALINLSKHSTTRSVIKEINCKPILIRVSELTN